MTLAALGRVEHQFLTGTGDLQHCQDRAWSHAASHLGGRARELFRNSALPSTFDDLTTIWEPRCVVGNLRHKSLALPPGSGQPGGESLTENRFRASGKSRQASGRASAISSSVADRACALRTSSKQQNRSTDHSMQVLQ